MKKGIICLLLGCFLLLGGIWIGKSGYYQGEMSIQHLEEDLSSFELLMRLVPQLKNKEVYLRYLIQMKILRNSSLYVNHSLIL